MQLMASDEFLNPWYVPGWTVQNPVWVAQPSEYLYAPFPKELKTVNVSGEFYTTGRRPMSGYLTFEPSSKVTYTPAEGDKFSILPRITKCYLDKGSLNVTLLATDNEGTAPATFTYHVVEHFLGGTEYDINVPKDSVDQVDITDLIIT